MSMHPVGNTKGLAPAELKSVERLARRSLEPGEIVSLELARELIHISAALGRMVGVLVSRSGKIEEIVLGTKLLLFLPDLGRYRLGAGRLRRLRLIFTDLSAGEECAHIPSDIYTDLEKLRLDAVVAVKQFSNRVACAYAYILPRPQEHGSHPFVHTEHSRDVGALRFDFDAFISEHEGELEAASRERFTPGKLSAVLVGVYECSLVKAECSLAELEELSRTAGIQVLERIIQRRKADPRSVVGKGKLQEVILRSLHLGCEMLIFDAELNPSQWRFITNSTELKVIDRSMLILDIFAQRATSSDGRLQVELAQLKYNLPRLVEKDAGLSRLTGGVGGRGPGETKLEIGRRTIRERIQDLEKRIRKLSSQRELRRSRRRENELPLVAIVGYTNAGKSTLFNTLTDSDVLVEDRLFATLDPAHRRLRFPNRDNTKLERNRAVVLTDTVGFIRELPQELVTAFKATLEELHEASLLLHVIDIADPELEMKSEAVQEILKQMALFDIPQIVVLNKADSVDGVVRGERAREFEGVAVSALHGQGMTELVQAMERVLFNA